MRFLLASFAALTAAATSGSANAAWNVAHPLARMDYIYRQGDWTAIDTWSTPTFYFFRNGKPVGKLSGWAPGGEGERALRGELEKLGLH